MASGKIWLLIDDDPDDREIFEIASDCLAGLVNCYYFSNCEKALESLDSGRIKPDLIFLDLNLPKMPGKIFLAEMKKNNRTWIPVIVYTTSSSERDKEETLQLGASYFLTKPNSIDELKYNLSQIFIDYTATHQAKIA